VRRYRAPDVLACGVAIVKIPGEFRAALKIVSIAGVAILAIIGFVALLLLIALSGPKAMAASPGARPAQWCGWWMRTQFGGGPEYNLAWNWRRRGTPSQPHIGAIVVWRHHVGYITGRTSKGWIVKSGNDSNAVRARVRSLKGAVIRGGV
jgi:hypothetical protein